MTKAVVVGTSAPAAARIRSKRNQASSSITGSSPVDSSLVVRPPAASRLRPSSTASARSRSKRKLPSPSDSSPAPRPPATSRPRLSSMRAKSSGARLVANSSPASRPAAASRPRASSTRAKSSVAGPSSAGTPTVSRRRKLSSAKAPPAAKRRRASSSGASGERRLAPFVHKPSAATNERITRAFQQRLYLLNKRFVGDPNSPSRCDFFVRGSTGNEYEVKLQQRPSCTCPDFRRSRLCKHILFVMLRVLKLSQTDPRVWQKAYLTSELKELLDISATSNYDLVSESARQIVENSHKVEGTRVQREISGDCLICYEEMGNGDGTAKEPVVFCKACGNNVHRDCFEKWTWSESSPERKATCIYCRAQGSMLKGKKSSLYTNLSEFSDSSIEAR